MKPRSSALISRILPWIVLIHVLAFVVFWLTNGLFYASTNDYLANLLHRRLNYVSLLVWVSALLGAWSVTVLLRPTLRKSRLPGGLGAWPYNSVAVLYLLFFYGSFRLLFHEAPVQLIRIGQMWGYFRIFPDSALLLAFALLAGWALRKYQARRKAAGKRASALPVILVLAAYAGIWCLALVFPPGSVYSGQLPEKPRLIAHRGASMLAPENTLAAAQAAADLHAYGLETDIHVGRDGSLFLVHDDTFDRTTDIRQVYPGREKEPVEDFSLEEVNQLNAGRWFVEQDPFQAVRRKAVSSQQVEADQGQGIPTLSEELAFVRQSKQVFIFDLKPPPAGHPYASSFFDLALEQIHQAGIDPQVWFLVDERQLPVLRRVAPQMTPAFGANYQALPEAQELKALGYRLVNVEYGIPPGKIRAYQEAGLWVNVYTVDEPWQFSRLWLYGVASITTSNVAAMANLKDPMLSMPYPWFLGIWSVVGLLGVGGIFWTANFELRIWRERLTV